MISGGPSAISVSGSGGGLSGGSANAPGSFSATMDATSLSPGSASGTLIFSCVGGSPCVPQVVSVSITVTSALPPVQLSTSRNSLSFQAYQGRPAPPTQSLSLTATGGSAPFSVQGAPPWAQVSPSNGTVSGAATPITVTVIP